MKLKYEIASRDLMINLWKLSTNATVFSHPNVIEKLSDKTDWWIVKKGEQPICIWPVCLPDGQNVGIPDFTYYTGPMWIDKDYIIPAHRWLSISTQIYEGFIKVFIEKYGVIWARLPLGLSDIRVFDWWNYHQKNKPRFEIRPRYTACINDLGKKNDESIIGDFRELRRREIRRIQKHGLPKSTKNWTPEDFIQLYDEVFKRQGLKINKKTFKNIKFLCDLVQNGYGEVIAYEDHKGVIISALLLLYRNKIANLVLNLTSEDWRDSGLSTWMVYESIKLARDLGNNIYDFNGANSPNRGDDKHSYGATPELYFEIFYKE